MGKRLINIPLIFLLNDCSFNLSEIERKKENFSDFFLCFPETDKNFNKLDFEKQIIIRKKIAEEKRNRKFDCSEFRNFKGVKENIDKLNEQDFKDKSAPCRKPNISNCEPR